MVRWGCAILGQRNEGQRNGSVGACLFWGRGMWGRNGSVGACLIGAEECGAGEWFGGACHFGAEECGAGEWFGGGVPSWGRGMWGRGMVRWGRAFLGAEECGSGEWFGGGVPFLGQRNVGQGNGSVGVCLFWGRGMRGRGMVRWKRLGLGWRVRGLASRCGTESCASSEEAWLRPAQGRGELPRSCGTRREHTRHLARSSSLPVRQICCCASPKCTFGKRRHVGRAEWPCEPTGHTEPF